jgi:hypothetical protein
VELQSQPRDLRFETPNLFDLLGADRLHVPDVVLQSAIFGREFDIP